MKAHTRYLSFHVPERMGFVNITGDVRREVEQSGIKEGLCKKRVLIKIIGE